MSKMRSKVICGHVLDILPTIPADLFHCGVTSPPYWGLRDYGIEPQVWDGVRSCEHVWGPPGVKGGGSHSMGAGSKNTLRMRRPGGQKEREKIALASTGCFCRNCGAWLGSLGLEPHPDLYVQHIVQVFREFRRVLRKDGTLWLNIGDCYATGGGKGFKAKDLLLMPARVALALQADGWYLRSDIIWHKPNPMPESAKDRPTNAHEHLFLLSRSKKYYYDNEAIKEPAVGTGEAGTGVGWDKASMADPHDPRKTRRRHKTPDGWDTSTGNGSHGKVKKRDTAPEESKSKASGRMGRKAGWRDESPDKATRNKRNVWTIPTQPFKGAHFATFPEKLVEPCILAGSPEGGIVADIFSGSGRTLHVAARLGRRYFGTDMNVEYCDMAQRYFLEKED